MIYWLASYPKSGNTWLRIFFSAYRLGNDSLKSFADVYAWPIASNREIFEYWTGLESSDLTRDEIDELRPLALLMQAARSEEKEFVKVHDAWRKTRSGVPLIPREGSAGVIYLVRNPLDVAVSFAHHLGETVERVVDLMCDDEAMLASTGPRMKSQIPQTLLSWSGHIQSWVDEFAHHVLVLRYEDLLADPEKWFGMALEHVGEPVDRERLLGAIEASSFNCLQALEQQQGFAERIYESDSLFFRQGKSGAWREELSPDLARKMIEKHSLMMTRFGYLDNHGRILY